MTPTMPRTMQTHSRHPTTSNILNDSQDNENRMQIDSLQPEIQARVNDNEDEYSDFAEDPEELEIIDQLLLEVASKQRQDQNAPLVVIDIEDYEAPRGVHLPKVLGLETTRQWDVQPSQQGDDQSIRDQSAEARTSSGAGNEKDVKKRDKKTTPPPVDQDAQPSEFDHRSLLDRFRKPPMKALSVTDLVSPAWCELQYYYILTKHGRKRRTPAMRQGSAVHQVLEDEVHVTVPVTITKKEDSWGLRIWNIIQGLRTLRETGRTREMEIWGSMGGELVNGIIDELSYECPDPKLEEQSQAAAERKDAEPPLPEYQTSIRDYLVISENRDQGQPHTDALRTTSRGDGEVRRAQRLARSRDTRKIYITDVKTRGTPTLPTGSSIRPTLVQLHLYHHMLENLAQGNFSLDQLAERYRFDVNETFSDSFIAQVGGLNQEIFELSQHIEEVEEEETGRDQGRDVVPPLSTQDSIDILLQHNTLASLWEFMMEQFGLTFMMPPIATSTSRAASSMDLLPTELLPSSTPQTLSQLSVPPSQPTRLSPILTARYISTGYRHLQPHPDPVSNSSCSPRLLGTKSTIFNPSFLKSYLYDALSFWRGEKDPKGVEVHDAWKCRVCEFRDGCSWVKERDELAVKRARARQGPGGAGGNADGMDQDAPVKEGRRSRV